MFLFLLQILEIIKKYIDGNDETSHICFSKVLKLTIIVVVPVLTIFIFVPVILFYYFEDWEIADSIYCVIDTSLTIGFGEFLPIFRNDQVIIFIIHSEKEI